MQNFTCYMFNVTFSICICGLLIALLYNIYLGVWGGFGFCFWPNHKKKSLDNFKFNPKLFQVESNAGI